MADVSYSQHDPIIVDDEHGNNYLCLNTYEVKAVRDLMVKLQNEHGHKYDTGDWWLDVPAKIDRYLKEIK